MNLSTKIKDLYHKYYELISYLFFGVMTTIVSFLTYVLCARLFLFNAVVSNIVSWIISVLFAYITNRKFVFKSKKTNFVPLIKEMLSFFGSRIFSGFIETLLIYIFVDLLGLYDIAVKLAATIIVIILNYIFSKLLVFKNK